MRLVAACNHLVNAGGHQGNYFFDGDILVNGVFIRYETETFGDTIRFKAKSVASNEFPGLDPELRFSDEQAILAAFASPRISANAKCWRANAAIRLHALYSLYGPGTDSDGNYVERFTVEKVGPFKKCNVSRPE